MKLCNGTGSPVSALSGSSYNWPFASEDRFTRCGISIAALRGVGQLSSRVASAHSFAHYGGNCFWPAILRGSQRAAPNACKAVDKLSARW
jgi:hypothetical protein